MSTNHRITLPNKFIPDAHLKLLLDVINKHGHALLVGGCVRDFLLGLDPKDLDIEVYGLLSEELEKLLSEHFIVIAVGKSFGIFKVVVNINEEKKTYDIALPRKENKEGQGHKGFVITTDPFMSFKKAAQRRDFTINAMAIDVESNELIDDYGGLIDLQHKILRHIGPAFKEDPLRVLRAAQFCARFDLTLAPETISLCQELLPELKTLSKERIFWEMKKLLLSKKPSLGLKVLRETYALDLFSELKYLIGCKQDPEWHPEGDVWIHSLMVADQAAKLVKNLNEDEQLIVMAGALCHDLGKPLTTILKDGRIKSPGHEQAGALPTYSFLSKMGFPKKYQDQVVALVEDHLKPFQLYKVRDQVSPGAIRRLCARVNINHLLLVSQADFLGRTTKDALSGFDPSAAWLKEKVQELLGDTQKPEAIIKGRHLIAMGQKPGLYFSKILKDALEAQMDGEFSDEDSALLWLKKYLGI
jgi:tRNA nucleotidyltransferase (CCA-adding enzyme)